MTGQHLRLSGCRIQREPECGMPHIKETYMEDATVKLGFVRARSADEPVMTSCSSLQPGQAT
jgi:hypothetical protein